MFDIRLVDLENTGHMLNTPDTELESRLSHVRALLREKNLGVLLILNRCSEGYTAWLTGCPMPDVPFNRAGGYIITADGAAIDVSSDTLVTEEFLRNYRKLDETVTVPATNPLFASALGFPIFSRTFCPARRRASALCISMICPLRCMIFSAPAFPTLNLSI